LVVGLFAELIDGLLNWLFGYLQNCLMAGWFKIRDAKVHKKLENHLFFAEKVAGMVEFL